MDLSRFVLLLEKRSLWFSHLPRLRDSHEGARGTATIVARTEYVRSELEAARAQLIEQGHDPNEVIDVEAAMSNLIEQDARTTQSIRHMTYVNCWHANDQESIAMWRLYGGYSGGIALESNLRRMRLAMDDDESIWCGLVNYVDQSTTPVSYRQFPANMMVKREAFASEREFRLACTFLNDYRESEESTLVHLDRQPAGLYVPTDVDVLLKRVVIGPDADEAFIDAVYAVAQKYGLRTPVVRSMLVAPAQF